MMEMIYVGSTWREMNKTERKSEPEEGHEAEHLQEGWSFGCSVAVPLSPTNGLCFYSSSYPELPSFIRTHLKPMF